MTGIILLIDRLIAFSQVAIGRPVYSVYPEDLPQRQGREDDDDYCIEVLYAIESGSNTNGAMEHVSVKVPSQKIRSENDGGSLKSPEAIFIWMPNYPATTTGSLSLPTHSKESSYGGSIRARKCASDHYAFNTKATCNLQKRRMLIKYE
jgi:hypothetical protein